MGKREYVLVGMATWYEGAVPIKIHIGPRAECEREMTWRTGHNAWADLHVRPLHEN